MDMRSFLVGDLLGEPALGELPCFLGFGLVNVVSRNRHVGEDGHTVAGDLNKAVADELSAVHQYLYFHFHLEDQGLGPLAILFRTTAIQEMGHIAALSERILFLKGDVNLQAADPVERIQDPLAILEKAMKMEEASIIDYNNFAIECGKAADAKTKQLFETLVTDEERHYDAWEKQLENIRRFGVNYLALQSFSAAAAPTEPTRGIAG